MSTYGQSADSILDQQVHESRVILPAVLLA